MCFCISQFMKKIVSWESTWVCVGVSGGVWGCLGLPGAASGCLGLSGAVWGCLEQPGAGWGCLGLSGVLFLSLSNTQRPFIQPAIQAIVQQLILVANHWEIFLFWAEVRLRSRFGIVHFEFGFPNPDFRIPNSEL